MLKRILLRPFARYLRDEHASVTVEAVMILPILLWGYFGMFILFDGYRALSANIRASYTISDMLSRETQAINAAYIEGLNDIQDVLTQSRHRTVLRVTSVRYRDLDGDGVADDGEHSLEWSYSTLGKEPIADGNLYTDIVPHLPPMPDSGTLIVVETWMAFAPFMNITLEQLYQTGAKSDRVVFGPFYFEGIVTTRPRFAAQLVWEGTNNNGGEEHTEG